jgi:hypothetical protein
LLFQRVEVVRQEWVVELEGVVVRRSAPNAEPGQFPSLRFDGPFRRAPMLLAPHSRAFVASLLSTDAALPTMQPNATVEEKDER